MLQHVELWIGLDQGESEHVGVAVGRTGEVASRVQVQGTGTGFAQLLEWIRELGRGEMETVAVGTETPDSAVVDGLLEAGVALYALNPLQMERFRDRFGVSGAKDDWRDAQVLADSLRSDPRSFRRVQVERVENVELRALRRHDEGLGRQLRRVANQVRSVLVRMWPELLELESGADSRWFWGLLRKVLATADGRLNRRQVRELLKRHRIRRIGASQVLEVLQTPRVPAARGHLEAGGIKLLDLLDQIELFDAQRRRNHRRIRELLAQLQASTNDDEPSTVTILESFPGIGMGVSATLLGEAGHLLEEHDYGELRVLAGTAPVTRRSGRSRVVHRRWSCNPRLGDAIHHWCTNAIQNDLWARQRYKELRGRGCTHPRALRQLGDSLLRRLTACLRDRTLYDPNRALEHVQAA